MPLSPYDARFIARRPAGDVDAADAPAELASVAALIQAAQAPATAAELADHAGLVAAMQEAVQSSSVTGPVSTPRSRLANLLTAKVAAIAVVTVVGATGAAAATGTLPAPAQSRVASALSYVGVDVPKPTAHDANGSGSTSSDDDTANGSSGDDGT